jgi:molybdopterin/thiamine biosynthesis adenylyltransferase
MTSRLHRLVERVQGYLTLRAQERAAPLVPRRIDVRLSADLFAQVRSHVENFSRGEEAGFLLCGLSSSDDRDVLLGREWISIPESAIERLAHGSVLSWSAQFNSDMLERALEEHATLVLIHSHGSAAPMFSPDDRDKEKPLFGPFSRLLDPLPTGTLLLGRGDAAGSFWQAGKNSLEFARLVGVGEPIDIWPAVGRRTVVSAPRRRLARQSVAIGPDSDRKLAETTVAVLGLSGGGSHVIQQLAHQGVGGLVAIDDDIVDEANLGRLVGARTSDVHLTPKTEVAQRLVEGVDPSIEVTPIKAKFPSPEAIEALKQCDIVVACVDSFHAREAINAFCRRYLLPLVDIGISIRSSGERLIAADGQVIVAMPSRPCLRCWFVTDAVLEAERRNRPPGYDQNPDAAGEPQVVSMNGTLASEACNFVLDLITGYSGGTRAGKFLQYDGRSGSLEPFDLPSSRPGCPACAQEGRGDPARRPA